MSGLESQSVLVASSDAVLQALLQALAADGKLPWTRWKLDEPTSASMAIVDVDRPDGLARVRRARDALGDTAAILVVGQLAPEQMEAALANGGDDVLVRPFTSESLLARLVVLGRRVARPRRSRPEAPDQDSRGVLESLSYPILVIRDDEHRYVNPAAARLLGYSDPGELIGTPIDVILEPDQLEEARANFRAVEAGGQGAAGNELRVRTATGEALVLALSPPRRIVFGGEPAVVVAARDVTAERMVEARLRLADRLTSVGTLAAGVAHEVNNPLASVVANVSVLEEMLHDLSSGWSDEDREEVVDVLRDARIGADRVQQIVRDLSTFANVDATTVGPVDVIRSLEATLNIAAPQIRHRALVVTDFQPVPPVNGNEARLGQVFLHLVLNAAQALPSGRAADNELRVRTRSEGERTVVIDVEDTGRGMSPEVVDRIFEPFFTTKPVGEGIGLGLSISHSIVEQMGGAIEVASKVGIGSRFTVRLPAAPPARRPTPEASGRQAQPAPAEILVADDEPMITKSLQRLLKGHHVTIASSGREALDRLAHQRFDLVVCDLIMPDFSGIDVYERLREMRPGDEERIVFITGGAFTPETSSFLDSVPNIWIDKPFDLKAVRALLELELGRR